MTGYTRDEIEARQLTWRRMTPPEWIAASEEQLKHLEVTGRLGPYEKEYILKDGSRAWMLFAGADLGDGSIVEFCIDISDRKRAEAERELLSGELSHRVKNVFAVVQSLAMQTNARTTSADAYRQAFLGRLQALARAHGLLLDSNWRGTDLKNLVEQTVAAYRTEQSNMVEIRGGSIEITAQQSLALSLVLNELCTNAVKYGALSDDRGRVMISWQNNKSGDGAAQLRLTWQEHNSRPVSPPGQGGSGAS
jgi:two-component sensor histidine kinase